MSTHLMQMLLDQHTYGDHRNLVLQQQQEARFYTEGILDVLLRQ